MGIIFPVQEKHFGKRLKALMNYKGIKNASVLAKHLLDMPQRKDKDMTEDEHRLYETYKKSIGSHLKKDNLNGIDFYYISKYCNFFNCSVDYFLGLIDYPTHQLKQTSEELGLSTKAIDKIKNYDDNIKFLFSNLVSNEQNEIDVDIFEMLLQSFYRYGISLGTTTMTIHDKLFSEDDEITDRNTIDNFLKYNASQFLELALTASNVILSKKVSSIQQLNLSILENKIKELEKEIQLQK